MPGVYGPLLYASFRVHLSMPGVYQVIYDMRWAPKKVDATGECFVVSARVLCQAIVLVWLAQICTFSSLLISSPGTSLTVLPDFFFISERKEKACSCLFWFTGSPITTSLRLFHGAHLIRTVRTSVLSVRRLSIFYCCWGSLLCDARDAERAHLKDRCL
jgi:hypothetical protein